MNDDKLDVLLAEWAERHALPAARAEAIRRAARASGPELSRRWWKDLFRAARQSSDPRPFLRPLRDA